MLFQKLEEKWKEKLISFFDVIGRKKFHKLTMNYSTSQTEIQMMCAEIDKKH